MKCDGFPPINYDLYVLGLLDPVETGKLNAHVERQCPTCLAGVKRSMRLWGVFTSSLGNAEPSSHFKERLQEIVGLSKSVLTFQKGTVIENPEHLPRWLQVALAVSVAAMLTLCGWYAGHTSGSLDHQHLITKVAQSEQELSSSRLQIHQQSNRISAALTASGQATAANQLTALQDRLRRMEAEVTQYKYLLGRSQRGEDNQRDLLLLLSAPNARLVSLKCLQPSSEGVGYALIVPNSKLVFVASNISDPPPGREYQLWIAQKSDSKPRSAGMFVPDEAGQSYLEVDDGNIVSDPERLLVTDEPAGGSEVPKGSKWLASES